MWTITGNYLCPELMLHHNELRICSFIIIENFGTIKLHFILNLSYHI